MILEYHGFDVRRAYSGEKAVEAVRSAPPDLVFCDILTPGMNGIKTALEIRAICPDCRVIFLSGAGAASGMLEQARANGHQFEILGKPVHPNVIIQEARAILRHHRNLAGIQQYRD
jgi:DNA-binding response OmpR family regulator